MAFPMAEPADTAKGRFDLLRLPVDQVARTASPSQQQLDGQIGYVHSFESAGTLDGPGIRFIVFTTGCPLRCIYCHNPDTWQMTNGRPMTVEAVFAEVEKYADFLVRWQSGVTISGGEPLAQMAFVARLLRRCKLRGLHTAIDTSGYLGHRMPQQMLDDTDLVLLDLKAFDDQLHRRVTGASAEAPRRFARQLSDLGKPMWVRFVLVPGLTDNLADVARLADFVQELSGVERVEVLPFHKMGEPKWKALGLDYRLAQTPPPSAELVETVVQLFRDRGLETY
jgi:pyruvate formate lyase activating enzyme